MISIQQCEPSAGFAPGTTVSWRTLSKQFLQCIRAYWRKRRERQELFEFIASDYRIAADIGITRCEVEALARRPFWRG